jgi:hypothetical protein
MEEVLEEENSVAFLNGWNAKRVRFDPHGNDQLVVSNFELLLVVN